VMPITLPSDVEALRRAVQRTKARFVVIDPLSAFLSGNIDSYKDADIRRALHPLKILAEETGAAVVVVRHLNKTRGGSAIYRGGGSIGITGAARSVLLVAKDLSEPERHVIASVKSNLGPPPEALAFHLEASEGTHVAHCGFRSISYTGSG
ncbi:MAG TPA: AAA family ATPase, partial [Acidimicrobiales bacterium]|nr:AAA family ATPase [Acidimicrobiales bacterium]